jgi:hypothetical protein
MFFLPVLIVLLLTRKLPIKSLILIPVIYVALLAPAFLAGRDAWSLLSIYLGQVNEYSGSLTMNAPTFYQWLPTQAVQDWRRMGMILASMMVALISFLTLTSRKQITAGIILKLTLVFALAIPFLLPNMHERYFYLADVISIIYAFCFPRYFYVAVIEQLCSFLSYTPYLFGSEVLDLAYVAFVVFFLIAIMLVDLVKTLYPNIDVSAAIPVASRHDRSSSEASDNGISSEGDVAVLPPSNHVLLNHALEKEPLHGTIERHPCDLLRQEMMFLKRPSSYVMKKACLKDHQIFLLILALPIFLRFCWFISLMAELSQDKDSGILCGLSMKRKSIGPSWRRKIKNS